MCLAIVALDAHPRYRVVIAANRDEFHARAATPAHWWPSGTLGGRDLVGGGAWFGITRAGRWALVTNFREAIARDPDAPSRGELVIDALLDRSPPLLCAASIACDGAKYHGFNLLVGQSRPVAADDSVSTAYASNRASGAIEIGAGVHGLSNHLLDTPWPKVVRSKARLAALLSDPALDTEGVFEMLANNDPADDSMLPATEVPRQRERILSSAFIVSPEYGTRCSTVLMVARDGSAEFVERTFDPTGNATGESAFSFALSG
jgi:uncharacterized protein with NRDE domain